MHKDNHKLNRSQKVRCKKKKKIDDLVNRGVFIPDSVEDVRGHRINEFRSVDYIKHEGTLHA